jgi:recombination protein RecR
MQQLITELARLPGIGKRTAQRLTFSLQRSGSERMTDLARAVEMVRDRVVACDTCFGFSETPRCAMCMDPRREESVVCVVEQPTDILLVERTLEYRGRYHVLGGALSPIDGVSATDIRIAELVERVRSGAVTEVIVATSPTMAGEATASFLADALRPLGVQVSRPASGLPVGIDLDQADEVTLGRAFAGRRVL